MAFRITTTHASDVLAAWPPAMQRNHAVFLREATTIATRHGLTLQDVAHALFLFHDLGPLFDRAQAEDIQSVFVTLYASPEAR